MEKGFYKILDGQLLYTPNYIEGNGFLLLKEEKDKYEYPIDGWFWIENEEEAPNDILEIYRNNENSTDNYNNPINSIS